MRAPLSWLREFTSIDVAPDDLAAKLSLLGLAVEEIVRTGEGIENVVVGRVLEVRDHPTSNKPLVLVKADPGTGETLDIVCGARNFGAGDVVAVALPGAKLPNGMEIVKRKVAGEVSNGMLCSAKELQIADDHSGIMVLDQTLTLGQDIRSALSLDDVIFDLDVTPNRSDCLSILGVAREVAAAYGLRLTIPGSPPAESDEPIGIAVRIEDEQGCPRYVARVVTGLASGSSPWWMRRRLLACGMRPISMIVDVTNYVMLELGQPLHAFDLANVRGNEIVVRAGRNGETLQTLDGVDRTLTTTDVLICDAERAVAVGGVMGGGDSEVTDATSDVLIESALFDPVRVLRTARRLGLRTEASVRFERGIDVEGQQRAADRAAGLLATIGGGTVHSGVLVAGPGAGPPERIHVSMSKAASFLGIDVAAPEASSILASLGCDVQTAGGDAFAVTPPSWRPDLRIEEDLFEEIARRYGYDRVPVTLPQGGRRGGLSDSQQLRRLARRAMLGFGLSEAHTLSLISPGFFDRIRLHDGHPWRNVMRVANPLSDEESVLRSSLLPGLLLAAQRNIAHRQLSVALFEIGTIFTPSADVLPSETLTLAWVMTGPRPTGWHGPAGTFDFFDAKGAIETLASALGIADLTCRAASLGQPFHPARSAEVEVGGSRAGLIAELHPRAAEALDLPGRVAVGVVEVDLLLSSASSARALALPKFPAAERDIAVVVPAGVPSEDIADVIRSAGGSLLEHLTVFDVYIGAQVGDGNVSVAFALSFRDPARTLTDQDVEQAFGAITAGILGRGWTIRD